MPGGQVFYVVPGNEGYVYDPVASNASGRKVFRANPQASISKQQQEEQLQQEQIDQQKYNQSAVGQAVPVALGVGGLIAAQQFMPQSAADIAAAEVIKQQTAKQVASSVVPAAPTSQAMAASQGFIGPQLPGAAPQAVLPEAASGFSLGGIGAQGNYLLPAAGAAGGYNLLTTPNGPVRGTLQGAASGAAMGSYFGPAGIVPGAVIGGGLGLAESFFDNPSTRDIAKEHTGDLLGQGANNPNWQSYVQGMREQHNYAPPDPSMPYGDTKGNKYANFDDYKKAGLDPANLTGVYGNLQTFGPEWANLSEDQRIAVTKGVIDANLYKPDHGEVVITDPTKAKEIKDNVLKGFNIGQATAPVVNPKQVTPAQAAASSFARPLTPTANLNPRAISGLRR